MENLDKNNNISNLTHFFDIATSVCKSEARLANAYDICTSKVSFRCAIASPLYISMDVSQNPVMMERSWPNQTKVVFL